MSAAATIGTKTVGGGMGIADPATSRISNDTAVNGAWQRSHSAS
jgi:hypothetical protein